MLADEKKQNGAINKEDAAYTIVSLESVLLTTTIDTE